MFDKIIRFSIYNKLIIGIGVIALIAWGGYSLTRLSIDAVPDITNNQVQVITVAPTLAAQEVEQYVTAPIEFACLNLPEMVEFRSISRLGLSVITIVFKDDVDIYLARQWVNERLKQAEEDIPKGIGTPELGPVTTGLSEIYQYVVHTEPKYDSVYSAMELRTIQDWIIRKQLLGIAGVAEVNTLGGYLKQYEIAINTDKLKSLGVTIPEVFEALKKNNENTGGSYIEKHTGYYFIRGIGMTKSLEQIKEVVVKTVNNTPILVNDVAKVQHGKAIRYGAATRNGEGEVVVGIVMMLKGKNASEVTRLVKESVKKIQGSLPEGVVIEPYLDRSELVDRAISTVSNNLAEGALIVVFMLVLFLGNFRAGLVVASVIPLAMLFAICLMNLFGVSGNLMSLGAIDFGLIVDGAVIIVESIVYRIVVSKSPHSEVEKLTQNQMNDKVFKASSEIRKSASFGEVIILIVYLPLLTLTGIEGKMFIPMAQTVSFAIIGAFILSFTYVPMMSSLFLSKKTVHKKNISDHIMAGFQWLYRPVIRFSLKWKYGVVISAFALFIFSLFVFNRMGGEFIPTLEEGDLAINTRVMPGTSLSQNIKVISKIEKKLIENIPEVKEVVSRIGSAEVPTDPMSVEVGDIIVVLKDKKDWVRANTKEELAQMIKNEISTIPGVSIEISQPIQLRFNELMTGVRSDVAMKLYGEELDVLVDKSAEMIELIKDVEGVADLVPEQVTGLPQINVEYNRTKISQFGLDINQVNQVLRIAFAGEKTGLVFEGDRRFDMVVRLEEEQRTDIENIKSLWIPLPNGGQVTLDQLAKIEFGEGPMQISRDNGNRRLTIGLNVRNRDVLSVVKEIQRKLATELSLPPGYYITYGGQFENLVEANKRLMITVPIAMLLIIILLYFTFDSLKQTLLIFTAVPLSAIGGIVALWYRDMPFSISAGVGFIALFGVAVLDGIVLIAEFNRLKKEGVEDIYERVEIGTKHRLRPVLMTSFVASLGFLPMALSISAGAEVQRPLATVVIGGVISATLLTLIVLPTLYIIFSGEQRSNWLNKRMSLILFVVGISFVCPYNLKAQDALSPLTAETAVEIALKNNPKVEIGKLRIDQLKAEQKTAFDLPKTEVSYTYGTLNNDPGNDRKFFISQGINFPTVYTAQSKNQKQRVLLSEQKLSVSKSELKRDVKAAFYQLTYLLELQKLLLIQDSMYKGFSEKAEIRHRAGETSYIEMITAQSKYQEVKVTLKQVEGDIRIQKTELQKILHSSTDLPIADNQFKKLPLTVNTDSSALSQNPLLGWYNQKIHVTNSQIKTEKNRYLPDLSVGYLNQSLDNVSGYQGVQLGVSVPLAFWGQQGKVQSAKIETQIAQTEYEDYQVHLKATFDQQLQAYQKNMEMLNYMEDLGLKQADEILKVTQLAYSQGEIGYIEYIQNSAYSIDLKSRYLESLNQYNQTVININYLTGLN